MREVEGDLGGESSAFKRGQMLYLAQHYKEAQHQFAEHMKEFPDDAICMSYLGLCLARQGRKRAATEVAQQAIKLNPEEVFAHTSLATVYRMRRMVAEARLAVREALRLDPGRSDILGLSAFISCDQKKWAEALDLTAQGLTFDPRDENCLHARCWALINSGKAEEARGLLVEMLADNPEDSDAVSFLGYAALRQGKREEALEAFSQALRNDPENELARDGFLDALRMRYPFYGLIVRYLMWLSSLPNNIRWMLVVAEHFTEKFLRELAKRHPGLRPFISGLLFVWSIFSYLSFVARPVGNSLLRLSKYGRKILRADEVMESNFVSASIGLGLASWAMYHYEGRVWELVSCIIYFTMVIPLTNMYSCSAGWPRKLMGGFAFTLFTLGNLAIWGFYDSPLTGGSGADCIRLYGLLLMANQIVASQLEKVQADG